MHNNYKSYSYKEIANYFIKNFHKDKTLTNMVLQKLIYFANGFYLCETNIPLINEQFEAWRYGPVIKELYNDLKEYGDCKIDKIIQQNNENNPAIDQNLSILLDSVINAFGSLDAWTLSEISHIKEGAWDKAPHLYAKLDNENIKKEFKDFHLKNISK